jgi:hypothetical protein
MSMSLFREFSALLPYLQSVRKIKEYISFDVSFPTTWKLPKKFINEERFVEIDSTVTNHRMFSFVSEVSEDEIELVSTNIQNIIKYNLEREEKELLFQLKVDELKSIFEKQTLTVLKDLQFEIKPKKIELEDEDEGVVETAQTN